MGKTIAAVVGGVVLGITIAFANAGAFQFPWGSGEQGTKPQVQPPSSAQMNQGHQPAPPNAPEPTERGVALASWAPLVKRVMPTVVNVAVVQEIKAGVPFGGPEEGPGEGSPGGPGGPGGSAPGGPGGTPFGPG